MAKRIPAYALATVSDTPTILGVRLKPFSLGHYILMRKYEVPFVDEEETQPSIIGLFMGINICARTYEEFLAWIEEPNWWEKVPVIRSIAKWIWKRDKFMNWRIFWPIFRHKWENDLDKWAMKVYKQSLKIKDFNIMEKFGMFDHYIKEGSKMPHYWVEREEESSAGSHWSHGVLVTLTSKLGYTHSEALNIPIRKALMDYMKYAESEGMVTLYTEEDEEALEEIEANKKKELANADTKS